MKRIVLALAGCVALQTAGAGVYVELVEHDLVTQRTALLQKMYVQGGSGRFVDEEGRTSIIKNSTMYIIDDSDRTYIEFDKPTMQLLAKRIQEARDQDREQIAKLPPDQRAQMERELGLDDDGTHTVEAIDTGVSDKVDGRTCRVWDIKRNDKLDDQYCVVGFTQLPGNENLQAVFASFAKVFEEMAQSVPILAGAMSNEFDALNKVNGYPMRIRPYERGKAGLTETLVKVWREESIAASMFEIPAGYTRKVMPAGQ